jgi:hypothetical protein
VGRNNSKTRIRSHGDAGRTRPGQTRKTPKDLRTREREERGRGEGVGLYAVHMRKGGGVERGECGIRSDITDVIHTYVEYEMGV